MTDFKWRPIAEISTIPRGMCYLGGWQNHTGQIAPGAIYQKHTDAMNGNSFVSHFISFADLTCTPPPHEDTP